MRNILMLTAANLRKNKSQTFSVLLLIVLTAILLNIGFAIFLGMGSFFDERAEELNVAHFIAIHPENESLNATQVDFVRNHPQVMEYEKKYVLNSFGSFLADRAPIPGTIIIAEATDYQRMNPITLIGDSLPLTNNAVFLPHNIFSNGGYALGDEIRLDFLDTELQFTVAGSTEELMFGSDTFTAWRIYVSSETFAELWAHLSDARSILLSARMTDGWAAFTSEYRAKFGGVAETRIGENIIGEYGYFQNRVMLPSIPAMFIVMFALILLIVAAIVVRFRISNDIEESMVNIGVLNAVGYKSRQITMSIIAQFFLIALVGAIIGILPAQIILPIVISSLIEPMLAMPWSPAFNLPFAFVSLLLILGVVLLFSWMTTRRINKLHPITALRGGITTHNFKKNALPLDKTKGSLNFLLALKQVLGNKKQTIMLGMITFGLTFLTVIVVAMHYNVNSNMDIFVHTIIGDVPDANIRLHDANDGDILIQRLSNHPNVYSIFGREVTMVQINEHNTQMVVVEDFAYHEGYSITSGRFPLLYNEIALDGIALYTLGKRVGDWVTVRSGDNEYDFIISGSVQLMGSFVGMMRADGLRQMELDFAFINFGLYLTEGREHTAAFIESVREDNSDIIARISSLHGQIDNVLGLIGNLIVGTAAIILFVTAAVVILVLYSIVKTMIYRRKRDLGIQKAVGFTTLQLMNQITLSLTPAIIMGVLLGAMGGYLGLNPIFAAIMGGMGVAQANLPVPLGWIALVFVGLILLAYVVSMLIAWRIRKISAYALVSE